LQRDLYHAVKTWHNFVTVSLAFTQTNIKIKRKMKRTSTAVWKGPGKEGHGQITTQSHSLDKTKYNWGSRFENEKGTNPEELIAAAHAGCFTMKLSFLITDMGFIPEIIETKAEVTAESGVISHSHLIVKAIVPDMTRQKFEECANAAKDTCPVSRALFLSITMEATLTEKALV
jgi:osmotically inducible protein OsmC